MVGFNLTIANFALLLFTSYMAIQTHIFQLRTSIRESIEQLDDLMMGNNKIQTLLHEFSYYPPRRGVTMKFRYLNLQSRDIAGAGNLRDFEHHMENTFELGTDDFKDINDVTDVSYDQTGLIVECSTLSAVECRRIAEDVLIRLQMAPGDRDELPH